MYPASALHALCLADDDVARARAEGHVVGRGEGFVSREWRTPDGRVLALHANAADRELVCVVPFVGGLGWDTWTLESVREAENPHLSTARVRSGDVAITAVLPDYAARRKMFPVGLEVKASVVVVVEDWRVEEPLDAFCSAIEGDALGGVVVSGRVVDVAARTPIGKIAVEHDGTRVWLCGDPDRSISTGDSLVVSGRALVRIGAPIAKRGLPQ